VKLTRSEAMKLRHAVARVDGWLDAATAQDLADGLAWYDRARRAAESMAQESGLTVRQCAGVVAALSPRCQWASNVNSARRVVLAAAAGELEPVVNGTLANRAKAWRIACGEDPDAVLSGPKVRAFFANIMGDLDAVTVDAWGMRAAEGRDNKHAPKKRRYALLSEAYRRAAQRHDMSPRDAQAAVWTAYRRTHARALYDVATA
jgi:hypothetical protein